MNVEFSEDNSGSSKKTHHFRKTNGGWPYPPGPSPASATAKNEKIGIEPEFPLKKGLCEPRLFLNSLSF